MVVEEEWEEIEEFPDYYVGSYGSILNMKRGGSELFPNTNQYGVVRVGMIKDGVQQTRSLAQLVAQAFVPRPHEFFNTVIHLDGNRLNCRADNLMWRPRPYAIKYHKQFLLDEFHEGYQVPLIEMESGETYGSVKEACMANGLYFFDVVRSYVEKTHTPITFQHFRMLD